jgi:predicted nucleotidyltransferase
MSAARDPELAARLAGPVVETLCAAWPEVQAIYWFGSGARGEARFDSDVDLAVLGAPISAALRWELQERLAALCKRPVDLVDLRSASTVMRVQIIDGGRVLHDGDPFARQMFEATSLSAYARLNEERRSILGDIAASGRVYG